MMVEFESKVMAEAVTRERGDWSGWAKLAVLSGACAAANRAATQGARWPWKRLALFFENCDMLHQFVEFQQFPMNREAKGVGE